MGFDLSLIKDIANVVQKADNIDLYKKVLEVQQAMVEMSAENQTLRDEVKELKETLKTKGKVVFENNSCWLVEDGGVKNGPFCSACWDEKIKLINMHKQGDMGYFECPVCKNAPLVDQTEFARAKAATEARIEEMARQNYF